MNCWTAVDSMVADVKVYIGHREMATGCDVLYQLTGLLGKLLGPFHCLPSNFLLRRERKRERERGGEGEGEGEGVGEREREWERERGRERERVRE